MFRLSHVVTFGLSICKATMQASPELTGFSMWPLFGPHCQMVLEGLLELRSRRRYSVPFVHLDAK